jgi:hypothetical protein
LGLGLLRPSLEGGLPLLELLRATCASNSWPEFHLKSNHYSFVKASKAQISL